MVSLLLVPTFQQEIHHAIIPYYDVMYFPFLKPDLIWMRSKLYLKKIPTTSFSCLHFFAASWSFCGPPIIDGLKFGQVCRQRISSQRSFKSHLYGGQCLEAIKHKKCKLRISRMELLFFPNTVLYYA